MRISLLLEELENEFGDLVSCGATSGQLRTVLLLIYRMRRFLKSEVEELPAGIREHPVIIRLSKKIGG